MHLYVEPVQITQIPRYIDNNSNNLFLEKYLYVEKEGAISFLHEKMTIISPENLSVL